MASRPYTTRLYSTDSLDDEIMTYLDKLTNRSEWIRQAIRLRYMLEKNGIPITQQPKEAPRQQPAANLSKDPERAGSLYKTMTISEASASDGSNRSREPQDIEDLLAEGLEEFLD